MPDSIVNVQLDDAAAERVDSERLRTVALATLEAEVPQQGLELTIAIIDDEQMRALNREYAGIDAPTDVLSFSAREGDPFVVADDESARYLGDVLIALPTAERQAASQGHTAAEEMDLLVVHGCLHLLGYDHADEANQARMWARQAEILAGLRTA